MGHTSPSHTFYFVGTLDPLGNPASFQGFLLVELFKVV